MGRQPVRILDVDLQAFQFNRDLKLTPDEFELILSMDNAFAKAWAECLDFEDAAENEANQKRPPKKLT